MAYEAKLPEGVSLPEGYRIQTSDPHYQALEALAAKHKFSQAAFSDALAIEAQKVNAEHARARAAAPAPTPAPAPKPDFSKMSTSQKFQLALERSAAKRG